jgi:hypothetical protein
MIIETVKLLKHIGNNITFIERPDLKHTDCSMIYLPYRVCEDCYLLFETMNDIKNYQIEIANYFRNPVDAVNFGVDYFVKEKEMNRGGTIKLTNEDSNSQSNTVNNNFSHANTNFNNTEELQDEISQAVTKLDELRMLPSQFDRFDTNQLREKLAIFIPVILAEINLPVNDLDVQIQNGLSQY